jgi:hypothetical protein
MEYFCARIQIPTAEGQFSRWDDDGFKDRFTILFYPFPTMPIPTIAKISSQVSFTVGSRFSCFTETVKIIFIFIAKPLMSLSLPTMIFLR